MAFDGISISNHIPGKADSILGFLRCKLQNTFPHHQGTRYNSETYPPAWDPYTTSDVNLLEAVQYLAMFQTLNHFCNTSSVRMMPVKLQCRFLSERIAEKGGRLSSDYVSCIKYTGE